VGLTKYLVRRIIELLPIVLVALMLNFIIIHVAPGDPAFLLAGEGADPSVVQQMRHDFGLNKPLLDQLWIYIVNVLRGDLGTSYVYRKPVLDVIASKVPATLILMLTSSLFAIVMGTLVGAYSARRYLSKLDGVLSAASLTMYSIPVFWLGIILLIVFSFHIPWFPSTGMVSIGATRSGWGHVLDVLWHLVLPAFTLASLYFGQYFRVSRSSVLEVMREDYVTTARAVGFQENKIFMKYILRNAILPVVTLAGIQLGYMFAGAVLTETVFSWPGLGRLIYDSILARDYPLVTGSYFVISILVALASLLTDLAYAVIDPRVVYK
jgi:peptide/nickel transport system permease protein